MPNTSLQRVEEARANLQEIAANHYAAHKRREELMKECNEAGFGFCTLDEHLEKLNKKLDVALGELDEVCSRVEEIAG